MIRMDKRDPAEIEKVITWCQQDPFWQNNILSTNKLRIRFDQLVLKMKAGNTRAKRPHPTGYAEPSKFTGKGGILTKEEKLEKMKEW